MGVSDISNVVAIHTSDRKMFKDCRRKWDLASRMRRNLTPKKVNDKLWLGTGFHYALEHYYGSWNVPHNRIHPVDAFKEWAEKEAKKIRKENQDLWDEQEEMLRQQIELGIGMLEHYYSYWNDRDKEYFVEVIETEREFEVPILTPQGYKAHAVYRGKYDGVVKDKDGFYWILEHKTASNISTDHLPLDEQVVSYIWAAQQMYGFEFEGVIYNIALKKVPSKPQELKSGGLSKNKNIKTTYEVYKNALIEHYGSKENVPWEDYRDILDELKKRGNEFFWRKRLIKSQQEIQEIGERIYQEYRDMCDPNLRIYPRPSRDCMWKCDFREVCIAMNQGADYQYMLETMYEENDWSEGANEEDEW